MKQEPARLGKPQETPIYERILQKYSTVILAIFIILLVIMIIALVIKFVDIASAHNNTVVMVESGNYYNHLKDVI